MSNGEVAQILNRIDSLEKRVRIGIEVRNFIIFLLTAVLFLLIGRASTGQEITKVHTPAQATIWAADDAATLPIDMRPFVRYQYLPPWATEKWAGALSLAVNMAASQSSLVHFPVVTGQGRLLRWDLRLLAPKDRELARLIQVWDETASADPYFYTLQRVKVETKPYRAADGKTYTHKLVEAFGFAPHIPAQEAGLLLGFTDPDPLDEFPVFPIARADVFLSLMLSSIDGGRYYDFLQLVRNPEKGTERDALFRRLGANEDFSRANAGDRRVGIFESLVTGKPRQVEYLRGLAGRQSEGRIFVTFDIADGDLSVTQHPIYNLLSFQHAAEEIIWERPNGLHGFALVDNKGRLQDEVPPDIARDHNVPAPYTARLQSALSCITCHGSDDGLKPADNDVKRILAGRLNLFDDVSQTGLSRQQVVEELSGKFGGDFDKLLRRGRDDYSDAVFRATGGMQIAEVSTLIGEIYGFRRYQKVTPRQALLELGYSLPEDAPPEQVVAVLGTYLPDNPPDANGFVFEQLAIGLLKQGQEIRRADWDREYSAAAFRVLAVEQAEAAKEQTQPEKTP